MAMKKSLFVLSAAILALVACSKDISEPSVIDEPNVIEQETTILTFSSDRPQTKTAWDSVNSSVVWTTGDKIRVGYTLDGVWMAADGPADFSAEPKVSAKFYASNNVTIDGEHANSGTFTVPTNYSNSPSGSAVFYGIYPSSCTETDSNYAPSLSVVIPTIQTPGANTFDKAADIMVGKTAVTDLSGAFPNDALALEWDRVVAHADITFKNLDVDGDASVTKITLAFNSDAKVVGTIYLDVTDGSVTTTGSTSNEIDIQGSNLSINEGNIEAWAAVLPVTFTSVDVTVKTDLATYTRSITGINKTFKKNARNTLGINMASATKTLNSIVIPDGNYVLAAKSSGTYYAISSSANGAARRERVAITTPDFDPSDYSAISPYTAANSTIWTVTNVTGGVKINLVGNTNSYMASGNNTLPLNDTGVTFEVSEDTGTYTFSNGDRYISMNGSYGFGCYTIGDYVKDLYVIPATGTPTLSFAETSKNVPSDASSVSFIYTSVFLSSNPTVNVSSDEGGAVASTSISSGTLTVNLNTNSTSSPKSVTLTVSADGASDVVLTITQRGILPDAENGDVLWAESFTGFSANNVPSSSNASTEVYGEGSVTYSCVDGGTNTKIYAENSAGGTSPELLISKNGGSFTVSGIPTGNATSMTLTFKSNNGCTISSGTDGVTIGPNLGSHTYAVTLDPAKPTISLTFTNSDTKNNTRVDNIQLVAGAPVAGITVTTGAATATSTAAGTTATLNGSLTLINGAVNGSVTKAGFYYKLTSAGSYDKVECASAPTSTTSFSYNLTGLTKGSEYTYYAFAIYDSGSEVTGEPTTFTPTKTAGGFSPVSFSFSRSGSSNTVTSGYELSVENGKANADNYQDKSGSVGLDLLLKKSDDSALFSTAPTSISITVKVGGGTTKNPLTNNVIAYLVDGSGNNIAGTATTVTTKVETTTGKEYTVSIPVTSTAYGLRIHHEKESSYNVKVYSVSFSAN